VRLLLDEIQSLKDRVHDIVMSGELRDPLDAMPEVAA